MGRPLLFFLLLWSGSIPGQDSLRTHFGPLRTLPDTGGTVSFTVSPGELGTSHTSDGSQSTWMGGIQAGVRVHHTRWDVDLHWEAIRGPGTFYRRAMESGWDRRTASGLGASRWRGRWVWSPLQSVDVIVGRDTLSEGWGVRSLFRGRHAAPAPFIQFAVDGGGRLRYRHRVEALQGSPHIDCWTGAVGDPRTWVPPVGRLRTGIERMLVSHRVEVDFGNRLTGALWGGVVWNVEDGRRAFEPHYLLPLTSLRPTEYAQGSSDNALVGLEGRIKLGSDWARRPRTLYGQFLLDELIVSELLGGTQWWGNKFALLGGIRWDTPWGGWLWEVSAARPWTYSHFTSTAAYLHGNTPLAHPLGANFVETLWQGHWQSETWEIRASFTTSVRGDDPTGDTPSGSLPQVGDIRRTEETYAWLNGRQRWRTVAFLDVGRTVKFTPDIPVQAFFQAAWGQETNPLDGLGPEQEIWIGFGLRGSGPFLGADW